MNIEGGCTSDLKLKGAGFEFVPAKLKVGVIVGFGCVAAKLKLGAVELKLKDGFKTGATIGLGSVLVFPAELTGVNMGSVFFLDTSDFGVKKFKLPTGTASALGI